MIDLSPLFGPQALAGSSSHVFRVFPRTGRERWILDTAQRIPWHLKTWPRANLRAKLIYTTAWACGKFGIHLPSRLERYSVAPGSLYAQLEENFDQLGIFLGTPGPNRKFVVYAGREGQSFFIKIPLNQVSAALVARETAALVELSTVPDLAPLVPRVQHIAGHLALENMEGAGTRYAALDLQELLRIHELLFRRSARARPLSVLRQDWEGEKPVGDVISHTPESGAALAAARRAANKALDALPQDLAVPCYKAHGDFTRWNVLRARDGKARIVDWELYGVKPKWFDVVHYIVSHDLLVSRAPTDKVIMRLAKMFKAIGASAPEREWWQHVTLYFAYQCLYYVAVYERQVDLNDYPQATWQLEAWSDILSRLPRAPEGSRQAEVVKA